MAQNKGHDQRQMSILKSKAFWALTGGATAVAGALTYDKWETKKARDQFKLEAQKHGEVPWREGDRERKISLVLFSADTESAQKQKEVFQKYSVDLLTKAGIDYQWVSLGAADLDKRYYQDLKEKEIREAPEGQLPAAEEAKKGRVFDDSFVRPMMRSWLLDLNSREPTECRPYSDGLKDQIFSESYVRPTSALFFTDGIVAMNPGTFRSLLWGFHDWFKDGHKPEDVEPTCALINCEFPTGMLKRMYFAFNSRQIAKAVGEETMAVIAEHHARIKLSEVLPSEYADIDPNMTIKIYK